MNSLEKFKEWCREAFSFLVEYGFIEEPLSNGEFINEYQVIYSKDEIKLVILGINYGANAAIYFIAPNKQEISYTSLVETNDKFETAKKKNLDMPQKEQIYFAGDYIKNNLKELLRGDYSLLVEISQRFADIDERNQKDMQAFLGDPEAQAKRAATIAITEAGHAFKNKDFKRVVKLLEPHYEYLPSKQIERLIIAKSMTRKPKN